MSEDDLHIQIQYQLRKLGISYGTTECPRSNTNIVERDLFRRDLLSAFGFCFPVVTSRAFKPPDYHQRFVEYSFNIALLTTSRSRELENAHWLLDAHNWRVRARTCEHHYYSKSLCSHSSALRLKPRRGSGSNYPQDAPCNNVISANPSSVIVRGCWPEAQRMSTGHATLLFMEIRPNERQMKLVRLERADDVCN